MIIQLLSSKWTGRITLVYELQNDAFECKGFAVEGSMTDAQWEYFCGILAGVRTWSDEANFGAFEVHKYADGNELLDYSKNEPIRRKIALYCAVYKNTIGIQYKVLPADTTALRRNSTLEISEDLIKVFLTQERWWSKGRLTIENLVRNYNALKLMQQGADTGSDFPAKYDPSFERAITGQRLSDYWTHLKKLGWKPVKHEVSNKVVGWADANGIITNKY